MDGIARDSVTVYPDGRLRARAVNLLWISVELRRAFVASIVGCCCTLSFRPTDHLAQEQPGRDAAWA